MCHIIHGPIIRWKLKIEKPLRSSKMEQVVPEWDAKFVDAPQETLFELILGANYMDIKPLLDLTCAKVASVSPRCAHLRAAPRPFSPRPSQSESAALVRPPPAQMIKGKTPEEIRRTFNIVNDFTPEEENQVREENKWCEEA